VNLRFGVDSTHWSVTAWGRNLTDNRSRSFGTPIAFVHPSDFERARTYGIDLIFEF